MKVISQPLIMGFLICLAGAAVATEQKELDISDVRVEPAYFNPSKGEKCRIGYRLSEPALVTIKLWDGDYRRVRLLENNKKQKRGIHQVIWDGRDDKEFVVLDEAYTITIEAHTKDGRETYYYPELICGGEKLKDLGTSFRRQPPYIIKYKLSQPARLRMMTGIKGGPFYRILLDWVAKPAGDYQVIWDGKDEDGVTEFGSHPNCILVLQAFALPENSVITTGNPESGSYLQDASPQEIRKPDWGMRQVHDHARHLRSKCCAPQLELILPEDLARTEDYTPIVSSQCPIKVLIAEKDLPRLSEEKFELRFFLDDNFMFEAYDLKSSYELKWDTCSHDNGLHILAVNLISLSDHLGVVAVKVYIEN